MSAPHATAQSRMDFTGRIVVVTGGGYGIGKEAALSFGRMGANVIVAARSADKIEQTAYELREMGTDPLAVTVDISSEQDVIALTEQAMEKYGRIDVLVNNSAISGPTAEVADINADEWRETMDINLTGTFLCSKHIGGVMRDQKSGHIVTLTSTSGRGGYAMRSAYCATRWGVIGLTKTMAMELGPHGVYANIVMPGPVEGPRVQRVFEARAKATGRSVKEVEREFTKDAPLGRSVTQQEVCDAILFLACDLSSGMQGQIVQVDGGRRI